MSDGADGSRQKGQARLADAQAQPVRIVEVDEHAGQRLDNFLLRLLANVPKSRVYRMLRKGEVRINGSRKRPTYRLQQGDRVRIPPHRAVAPSRPYVGQERLAELELAIRYEDDALLVLDKPAGIAVHGGSGIAFGIVELARRLRGDQVELAHRLDRDTSGCLLLVKRRSALRQVHSAIRAGTMRKRYELIVSGVWPDARREVSLALRKFVTSSGERRVRVADDGRPSLTRFRVQAHAPAATWLQADLVTGRTHQIRVHAAASGHPILGDTKYASDFSRELADTAPVGRLCLHAAELTIPWEGGELAIHCDVPGELREVWRRLSGQPLPSTS